MGYYPMLTWQPETMVMGINHFAEVPDHADLMAEFWGR